jgi:hypothetical protein
LVDEGFLYFDFFFVDEGFLYFIDEGFLAHLAFRPCELLSSLFVRRLSSVVRPSTFHILIFSSETTGPIATKLWWNGPWMAPFQNVSGDPDFQPRWPPS